MVFVHTLRPYVCANMNIYIYIYIYIHIRDLLSDTLERNDFLTLFASILRYPRSDLLYE